MDKIQNLWPDTSIQNDLQTDNVTKILNAQCNYFNESNKDNLSAQLCPVKKYQSTMQMVLIAMSHAMVPEESYIANDPTIKELNDINPIIRENIYSFVIKSNKYRFDVFYIRIGVNYPVTIEVDLDIAEELKEREIIVNNESELIEKLQAILKSNKLSYTIRRMAELSQADDTEVS